MKSRLIIVICCVCGNIPAPVMECYFVLHNFVFCGNCNEQTRHKREK